MSLEELFDILLKENASDILRIKEEELFALIPELRTCKYFNQNSDWHIYDVFEHILHVIDNVPANLVMRLTALFHDIGKPNVYTEDENGVVMHEHTLDGEGMEKRYESKVHAYQDFTSINFFLESATYIGKFFRRTKRVFNEDAEYLPVNHNIFALYELDGVILVVKSKNGKTVFDIISTQFTRDGNFEYYGSQKDTYNDKKAINKEIVKQLKKIQGLNI